MADLCALFPRAVARFVSPTHAHPTRSEPNSVFCDFWWLWGIYFYLIQIISLRGITCIIDALTHIAGILLADGISRTGLSVPHGGAPSDNHMAPPRLRNPPCDWLSGVSGALLLPVSTS